MIIFDGYQVAAQREAHLKEQVVELRQQGLAPHIAAILLVEDAGSQLYTRLKQEAAERIGIEYDIYSFSLQDEPQSILKKLTELNSDPSITGIIIQKPSKQKWLEVMMPQVTPEEGSQSFNLWWQLLVSQIELSKDVDGLHPQTLAAIQAGNWSELGLVLPATAKAVMEIVQFAARSLEPETDVDAFLSGLSAVVIGKSDIVGKPVFYALSHKKCNVEMIGSKELREKIAQGKYLNEYRLVISSTGRQNLISAEMLASNSIVIDVGEPRGDVDRRDLETKVAFLTPVPGGVGPMTVSCLLENAITLVARSS